MSPWVTRQNVAREQPSSSATNGMWQPTASTVVTVIRRSSSHAHGHPHQDLHDLTPKSSPMPRSSSRSVRASTRTRRCTGPGARPSRLRLLRPQHPCEQGRWLRHMPRPCRPHAAHVAGEFTADVLVPRLPSQPRTQRAAARRRVPGRLPAAVVAEPRDCGRQDVADQVEIGKVLVAEYQIQKLHQLLDVSPMKTGKAFWRTLDELADDPSFVERLHNEFPLRSKPSPDPTTRRTFMKLMGASLALAGVTGLHAAA